jgi:hypothetical protein
VQLSDSIAPCLPFVYLTGEEEVAER